MPDRGEGNNERRRTLEKKEPGEALRSPPRGRGLAHLWAPGGVFGYNFAVDTSCSMAGGGAGPLSFHGRQNAEAPSAPCQLRRLGLGDQDLRRHRDPTGPPAGRQSRGALRSDFRTRPPGAGRLQPVDQAPGQPEQPHRRHRAQHDPQRPALLRADDGARRRPAVGGRRKIRGPRRGRPRRHGHGVPGLRPAPAPRVRAQAA